MGIIGRHGYQAERSRQRTEGKMINKIFLLFVLLFTAAAMRAADSEELSFRGWQGSADFDGSNFNGCHIDSPASLTAPHYPMRILAADPWYFLIGFVANQHQPEQQRAIRLSLANDDQALRDNWTSDHGYIVLTAINTAINGQPTAGQQLIVSADDELISHLSAARYLVVNYPVVGMPLYDRVILDLRHDHSPSNAEPDTTAANDTAGAIAEVMDCVKRHRPSEGGPTGSASFDQMFQSIHEKNQADTDYYLNLHVMVIENAPNRTNITQELIDAGKFYCDVKRHIPYDAAPGDTYDTKTQSIIQVSASKLSEMSFWSEEHTADDILLTDRAMGLADRHVCPGWPGYPRPPG
jgi:hypothetical protein